MEGMTFDRWVIRLDLPQGLLSFLHYSSFCLLLGLTSAVFLRPSWTRLFGARRLLLCSSSGGLWLHMGTEKEQAKEGLIPGGGRVRMDIVRITSCLSTQRRRIMLGQAHIKARHGFIGLPGTSVRS